MHGLRLLQSSYRMALRVTGGECGSTERFILVSGKNTAFNGHMN